eukprot:1618827-Prorocentrum_lima.AAC.1
MTTASVPVKRGLRQGCPLSPFLWNTILSEIFAKLAPKWQRIGCSYKLLAHQFSPGLDSGEA